MKINYLPLIEEMRKDNRTVNEAEIQRCLAEYGGIEFSYTGDLFPIDFIEDYFDKLIEMVENDNKEKVKL